MQMRLCGSHYKLLACFAISFCFGFNSSLAAKSGKPLEGNVKQDASLNPSLRVLPAPDRHEIFTPFTRQDFFPLNTDLVQYKGGVRYVGGKPAPLLNSLAPTSDGRKSGVIPPIYSYTLTPQNSVMWVAPGYEVSSAISQRKITTSTGGQAVPAMNKGVTTWEPGYESSSVISSSHRLLTKFPITTGGVTTWEPGYEVLQTRMLVQMTAPGREVTNVAQYGPAMPSAPPNQQISVITSRHGVVCWTPGYEVSVQTPGLIKTSLGGLWYAPGSTTTSPGNLPTIKTFLEAVPGTPSLVATPLLLPELRVNSADKNLDWDGWYKRVAKAIYSRWQCAEVGPGSTTVRVIITTARDLSCQVVDFTPAEGIDRNVVAETSFREAAVRAVRDIRMFEIPELPPLAGHNEVTFDVEMRRTVDGPIGIDLASFPKHNQTSHEKITVNSGSTLTLPQTDK
jgi:hypothetical protein